MSYTLNKTGAQIDAILDRADTGGAIDAAIALKAPLASPALTGTPTAPTASPGTDTTQIATTAFVTDAVQAEAEADALRYAPAIVVPTSSAPVASFSDGADGVPIKSGTFQIVPTQSGSGTPAPDNVRPISGWTGANVNVTAVNIYDQQWELGTINVYTGKLADSSTNIRSKNRIPVYPSTSYRFLYTDGATNVVGLHAYDADDNWLGLYDPANGSWITTGASIGYITGRPVFTTPANAAFVRFRIGGKTTYTEGQASINTPSTVTDYMPFGAVYPISWSDEAGTVYGGHFVVNEDGSVDLTVTRGGKDLGTLTWTYEASPNRFKTEGFVGDIKPPTATTVAVNAISSLYKPVPSSSLSDGSFASGTTGNVFVKDTRYTVAADFKTAVAGQTIVYELATPVTYRLDSIGQITTLLGSNAIWSDTGDAAVEYRADTKLYIDGQIAALQALVLENNG